MYTLTDVTKTYRQGKRTVTALERASTSRSRPARWSRSRARPAAASRPCCRCSARSTGPPPARCVLGDDDLSAGGRPSSLTSARATEIGFVFQGFNLIPTLTALENVETALAPLGVAATSGDARSAAALESVGLGERADHLPAELSGGQQQRVADRPRARQGARRCCSPTSRRAASTRRPATRSWTCSRAVWRDRGLTLVIVTHDSAVAHRAERRLHLKDGQVREVEAAGQPRG